MSESGDNESKSPLSLKDFKIKDILFNDAGRKKICLLGWFPERSETDLGIVIVEKVEFATNDFSPDDETKAFLKHLTLDKSMENDIYSDFKGFIDATYNGEWSLQSL